jgi:hypothetical protein
VRYDPAMTTRGGIVVIGIALLTGSLAGCADAFSAPTSTSDPSPSPPVMSTISPGQVEAQQRAESWIDATPVPPNATRTERAPRGAFTSFQAWVCTPTMTASGYWTVTGMSPAEVLNWMLENPAPDLTPTSAEPMPLDGGHDGFARGFLPSPDSQEGIVFTFVTIPEGTALRAESGATTADSTCPPPPGGGSWGRPGEG